MSTNLTYTTHQLIEIRNLPDFDLIMFLSEINDHGHESALQILELQTKLTNKSKLTPIDIAFNNTFGDLL